METQTQTQKQIKLLVVEDEQFLRDLLLMKFKSEGVLVTYAGNGEQALESAKKEKFDVILLDLVLPGMSGFEVLEQLKSQEESKDTPVVILSNLGQESDIKRCSDMGADGFLIKAHTSPSAIIYKVKEIVANNK